MRGEVAWFSNVRSYGFITPHGGGKDVFVYYQDIVQEGFKTLQQGDKVEFDIDQREGRTVAVNVVKLEAAHAR